MTSTAEIRAHAPAPAIQGPAQATFQARIAAAVQAAYILDARTR
jgi:hypothetical protein